MDTAGVAADAGLSSSVWRTDWRPGGTGRILPHGNGGAYKLPLAGKGTSTSMYYKVLIHEPRVHEDLEVGNKVFRCEEGYFWNLPPLPYTKSTPQLPPGQKTLRLREPQEPFWLLHPPQH